MDPYYSRPEISNSDLNTVIDFYMPKSYVVDKENAYRFGTLVDAIITEPQKVNLYKRTCDGYFYTEEEIKLAMDMALEFNRDSFCKTFAKVCDFQAVSIRNDFPIQYGGLSFTLPGVRCKWDLLARKIRQGGDIKSTFATTQRQFEDACEYFRYYQSRAFYMDIEGTKSDVLIGISKKNLKIFRIHIRRGDSKYLKGKEQYEDAAFRYWAYFDGFKLPIAA